MRNLFILALISGFLSSCGEPTINGKLVDNFDNPIEKAKVEIEGTAFTTETNSDGEYSIEFVPGEIKLKYSKENYLDTILNVNISTKDDFPAQIVKTLKIPPQGGIYIVGEAGYSDLKELKNIENENSNYTKYDTTLWFPFGGISGNIDFNRNTYFVSLNDSIPKLKSGKIQFADTDSKNIMLLKLDKKQESKFLIGSIEYPTQGYHSYGNVFFSAKGNKSKTETFYKYRKKTYSSVNNYSYTRLDKRNKGNTFGLWNVELNSGYYAFVYTTKDPYIPFESEVIKVFSVE